MRDAVENEFKSLNSKIDVLSRMAKQANDDSCYWQSLYQNMASEEDYNSAVKEMVNNHREKIK